MRKQLAARKRRGTLIIPFGLFALVILLAVLIIDIIKNGGL